MFPLRDSSNILYIDSDKKRTDTWLSRNQLHLPLGIDRYGPIGSIALVSRDGQGNFSADSKTQEIPEWKKLQSFEASYGSSFEERARKAGGKVPEKSQQQKAAETKQRVTAKKRGDLLRSLRFLLFIFCCGFSLRPPSGWTWCLPLFRRSGEQGAPDRG